MAKNNIEKLRRQKRLTQEQLADIIGISLIYKRKDKCYELLIIAGKAVVVDLPYSI